jgi:predicted TIM-barrel fold metal-dependent hydrolase
MINGAPVIDMQHHYIPQAALQFVGKTAEFDYSVSLKRFRKAYEKIVDITQSLAFMDEAGIDTAILSTGSFTPNGYDFCRACNDGYAEIVKKYPKRFKGMIHVYPLDGPKNRDEVKRCVEDLGLGGLALMSSYGESTIDGKVMDPLYEMAVNYDMPVFIHPTIRVNLWGGEKYDLYTKLSREYDMAKSFVEIVYGVLPRYPELKVIMGHFGGGLQALKGRLLAWHQPESLPIPQADRGHGLSIYETKELGLFDDFEARLKNMLFDSAGYGGWLPVIRSAFETLGKDHLCFGTDYPYELNKAEYVAKVIADIEGLDIPAREKAQFFSDNLRRFFPENEGY